jgi:hypothetical protein
MTGMAVMRRDALIAADALIIFILLMAIGCAFLPECSFSLQPVAVSCSPLEGDCRSQ